MSTRSIIAVFDTDETVFRTAYCHWGGHPLDNGWNLLKSYNDYHKAFDLVSQGDMSALEDYNSVPPGEDDDIMDVIKGLMEENEVCPHIEYLYVFVGNTWLVWDWHRNPRRRVLENLEDTIQSYAKEV